MSTQTVPKFRPTPAASRDRKRAKLSRAQRYGVRQVRELKRREVAA